MSETKTSWYFIVNPRAGSGKTMSEWVPAERLLEAEGIPFVTAMTDHKKHAITLAREAAADGYRRIAAVGGELTVKRLARRGGRTLLVPANPSYPEFDVTEREDVCIWGVVTYAVHKL